eukprot:scaffold7059_cov250-Pinguiococcus_pyrenoidosus.AAC.6
MPSGGWWMVPSMPSNDRRLWCALVLRILGQAGAQFSTDVPAPEASRGRSRSHCQRTRLFTSECPSSYGIHLVFTVYHRSTKAAAQKMRKSLNREPKSNRLRARRSVGGDGHPHILWPLWKVRGFHIHDGNELLEHGADRPRAHGAVVDDLGAAAVVHREELLESFPAQPADLPAQRLDEVAMGEHEDVLEVGLVLRDVL